MTLLEQIQQGESKTLELKASLLKGEQIAITVVAFANGGDIKVGIYDDIVTIVSPGGFPNTPPPPS